MENLNIESILLIGSILLTAAVLAGKSSNRMGLPVLLVFLVVGMLFGTDGLGIQFGDMHLAQNIGMVALCIILFSGGMGTKISAIRPVLAPGMVLSTAGVLLTALLTGLFIWWLSGMSWTNIHFAFLPSLLLASTMSSTDSASVFGILGSRHVDLRHNLRPLLELESGSNDPMAYMLTLVLTEVVTLGAGFTAGDILLQLLLQFAVGGVLGVAIGKLAVRVIEWYCRIGGKKNSEDSGQQTAMISILVLASVFFCYSATTALKGNGYLAVYICGIVVGNAVFPCRRGVLKFMDGLTWLAQIGVFLMLGLLVNPHEMLSVAAVSLLIGIFMIVAGRPLSVFLTLLPFRKINTRSKLFVSWVGLRGAVPIIFATYPVVSGVEGASQIFNIVFFVTLISLLVQGTTVISAARRLGLEDTDNDSEPDFGVELADELPTSLTTRRLTGDDLAMGNTLDRISLPEGSLVIMIRRGDKYIVPNGRRKLMPGDALLIISEEK